MMNYIKKIAIYLFDLIDKYIHQKNILKSIKKEKLIINTFIDIGAHKGKYTDLFINNYKIRNIYMFEPQSINKPLHFFSEIFRIKTEESNLAISLKQFCFRGTKLFKVFDITFNNLILKICTSSCI